jgi:hypothetical protein
VKTYKKSVAARTVAETGLLLHIKAMLKIDKCMYVIDTCMSRV